jgi:catechol 2,3-dioxygenase-like lactoylglutathione lyase family enzyme/heme-degrading monooxygenase HmoA
MPAGQEDVARAFYAELLGIPEVAKPEPMASRGGSWFERGELRVHLGVEDKFRPAKKAHPALLVEEFDAMVERIEAAGHSFKKAEDLGAARRGFVDDPFGNRVEIVEALPSGASFAVIYRWRLEPTLVEDFCHAWQEMTHLIRAYRGGLGSRLHRAADGSYLAYAQWPSRAAWLESGKRGSLNQEVTKRMQAAVIERFPDIELEACLDLLVPVQLQTDAS